MNFPLFNSRLDTESAISGEKTGNFLIRGSTMHGGTEVYVVIPCLGDRQHFFVSRRRKGRRRDFNVDWFRTYLGTKSALFTWARFFLF